MFDFSYKTLGDLSHFSSRISAVNVTKSAVACGIGHSHLLKKSLMENFIFCVVFNTLEESCSSFYLSVSGFVKVVHVSSNISAVGTHSFFSSKRD